jgi:uncharacterized ion transporter superfamily protein YfcC
MAWFGLAKIALQAGGKIYANRQKTKMAMSDAQLMHAERMARGEESYQGKLLESRQSDLKDEFVLIIISAPIIVLAWAVISDDPAAMQKVELFFQYFSTLPSWFTNLWILVVASIFGIKGTQIFRNGGKMNLLVQDVEKNQLRNNHLKLEETSPMENGANVLEEK